MGIILQWTLETGIDTFFLVTMGTFVFSKWDIIIHLFSTFVTNIICSDADGLCLSGRRFCPFEEHDFNFVEECYRRQYASVIVQTFFFFFFFLTHSAETGVLFYWALGYAFAFGGDGKNPFCGYEEFFLAGTEAKDFAFIFFQA